MAKVIAQRELRNQNAEIIDAVVAGESFIVTRHGTPVAELRPLAIGRRVFVPRQVIQELFAHSPAVDGQAFRRDIDEILDQRLVP